ncbi:MAG TPA: hypothetical protein ENI53_01260 [Thermoplasmatales archaeon]|nr:hypothetical protein [Thermoplasmatales archaeon]
MDFTWITYILIAVIVIIFILRVVDRFLIPKRKEIIPRDAQERLFKYIVTSSKTNPNISKYLYLSRTEYTPGGYIGKIIGKVSEHGFTKFAVRKFGKKVIYVPRNIHTSLYMKDVFLHGQDLQYINGVFFVIPHDLNGKWKSIEDYFDTCLREVEKDISKITMLDLLTFRDQVNKIAVVGSRREEAIRKKEELIDLEEGKHEEKRD